MKLKNLFIEIEIFQLRNYKEKLIFNQELGLNSSLFVVLLYKLLKNIWKNAIFALFFTDWKIQKFSIFFFFKLNFYQNSAKIERLEV